MGRCSKTFDWLCADIDFWRGAALDRRETLAALDRRETLAALDRRETLAFCCCVVVHRHLVFHHTSNPSVASSLPNRFFHSETIFKLASQPNR
jgi:hypothetical protein